MTGHTAAPLRHWRGHRHLHKELSSPLFLVLRTGPARIKQRTTMSAVELGLDDKGPEVLLLTHGKNKERSVHSTEGQRHYYCFNRQPLWLYWASQVALMVKNPPANAGDGRDVSSIPELGRPSGEGNGNPLQYSCLENPMDRGAWRAQSMESQRVGHD